MADPTAKASCEVIAALCEEEEAIAVYSASTGAAQAQVFRGSASARTALVSLHDRYLLAPHRTKPAITVWEWGRETPAHTCYVAERLTCLCADSTGAYVVGGSPSGSLYLWLAETGEFLCSWRAHYRPVTRVAFLQGELVLVTAAEDALVHAWSLADVLCARSGVSGDAEPLATWSEHSLPVTGLCCSRAGGAGSLVASSSLDHTCRVWRLGRAKALCAVSCPSPLLCCCLDGQEQRVYAGGRCGSVFEVSLTGAVAGEAGRVTRTLRGHAGAVTSVGCCADGGTLVSSSEDGSVFLWNRSSGERVRAIERDHPVRFADVVQVRWPRAEAAVGARGAQPAPTLRPLKKYKPAPGEQECGVGVTALPDGEVDRVLGALRGGAAGGGSAREAEAAGGDGQAEELAAMREELRAAKEELGRVREEHGRTKDKLSEAQGKLLDFLQSKNALV